MTTYKIETEDVEEFKLALYGRKFYIVLHDLLNITLRNAYKYGDDTVIAEYAEDLAKEIRSNLSDLETLDL